MVYLTSRRISVPYELIGKSEILVPETLEQAVTMLMVGLLSEEAVTAFIKQPHNYHFSTGMSIRNGWNLWQKTGPLNEWFRSHGIWHGDDKSGIIFTALECKIRGTAFDLEAEKQRYAEHWRGFGSGFDGVLLDKVLEKSEPEPVSVGQ